MWVCPICGSDNVQIKQWVNPNTDELKDSDPNEDEDCWCDDCETHNALMTQDIPVKNKVIGFQVVNETEMHEDMDGSFCIYSLEQANEMLNSDPTIDNGMHLLAIRKGDIEEPRMMFTGDPRQ